MCCRSSRFGYSENPDQTGWTLFRILQLSSAAFSLGHGGNDAQNCRGYIILLLASAGLADIDQPPMWVFYMCYSVISLGTMLGGWKVIRTMGHNLTPQTHGWDSVLKQPGLSPYLPPIHGHSASTTHTITGALVGLAEELLPCWQVVYRIIGAWVFHYPGHDHAEQPHLPACFSH